MDVRKLVEERFSPVVLVSACPGSEAAAQRNGMSVTQLLRPFCTSTKDFHVRTVKEYDSYLVKNFSVRLSNLDTFGTTSDKMRAAHIDAMMKSRDMCLDECDAGIKRVVGTVLDQADPMRPRLSGEEGLELATVSRLPWWDAFLRDYLHMVRCSHLDTFDHPTACILVASSSDSDPIQKLKNMNFIPNHIRETSPWMDPSFYMFFVLLHDMADPNRPSDTAVDQLLKDLTVSVGHQNCKVLRVNSASHGGKIVDQTVWLEGNNRVECVPSESSNTTQPYIKLGATVLTETDVNELSIFMTSFISAGLVPHLERRLRALSQIISDRKQGVMGKMAAWFKAPPPGPQAYTTQMLEVKYKNDTFEMQVRRGADTAFLLRDYEAAVQLYKTLRTELQLNVNERPHNKVYLVAVNEGIGLGLLLHGRLPLIQRDGRRDDNKLDMAREGYLECGLPHFSLRISLILYAQAQSKSASDRCAFLVARLLSEEHMHPNHLFASLCHEQAALSYLALNPPHTISGMTSVPAGFPFVSNPRKFALNILLAGYRFFAVDQSHHARRCYELALLALRRFGCSSWATIWEHIHHILCKLYDKGHDLSSAIAEMVSAFEAPAAPGASSPNLAPRHLSDYLNLLQAYLGYSKAARAPHLVVPLVSRDVVLLPCPLGGDARTNAVEQQRREAVLKEASVMEGRLREFRQQHRLRYSLHSRCAFDINSQRKIVNKKAPLTGMAQEPLAIQLVFSNPLAASIRISDISVLAYHTTSEGLTDGDVVPDQPTASFVMPSKEEMTCTLHFVAPSAGTFVIVGVNFTVESTKGSFLFDWDQPTAPLYRFDDQSRPYRPKPRSEKHIRIVIHPAQASLSMTFDPQFPDMMLHGEVYDGAIVLRNEGTSPATDVTVHHSATNLHLLFVDHESASGGEHIVLGRDLQPGESVRIRIVFRADVGTDKAATNYYYGMVAYNDESRRSTRLCRLIRELRVIGALRAESLCTPVSADTGHLYAASLRLSRAPSPGVVPFPITIKRIVAVCRGWEVSHCGDLTAADPTVSPGSPFVLGLLLQHAPNDERTMVVYNGGSKQVSLTAAQSKFLRLAPLGGSGGLGLVDDDDCGGGFEFYLDRGAADDITSRSENPRVFSEPREKCLAFYISWCSATEDGTTTTGETLAFVDPVATRVQYEQCTAAVATRAAVALAAKAGQVRTPQASVADKSVVVSMTPCLSSVIRGKFFVEPQEGQLDSNELKEPAGIHGELTLCFVNHSRHDLMLVVKPVSSAAQQGTLAWCGKRKTRLPLPAEGTCEAVFVPHFMAPGLYDLNMFDVQVSYAASKGGSSSNKLDVVLARPGPYLCEVVHDATVRTHTDPNLVVHLDGGSFAAPPEVEPWHATPDTRWSQKLEDGVRVSEGRPSSAVIDDIFAPNGGTARVSSVPPDMESEAPDEDEDEAAKEVEFDKEEPPVAGMADVPSPLLSDESERPVSAMANQEPELEPEPTLLGPEDEEEGVLPPTEQEREHHQFLTPRGERRRIAAEAAQGGTEDLLATAFEERSPEGSGN